MKRSMEAAMIDAAPIEVGMMEAASRESAQGRREDRP